MMLPLACLLSEVSADPSISTGKERDAESGNDYFGARYYASSMGRFLSPDWSANPQAVPFAKFDTPQTLNLYQHVGNNPLTGVDLDGHLRMGTPGPADNAGHSPGMTGKCDTPAERDCHSAASYASLAPLPEA